MHQDESTQANFEEEQLNPGGAAPEHRRCTYLKADGKGCRDWAMRGQKLCYRHGVYLRREAWRVVDVPLLEDEASIVLMLSQTLRAVVNGAVPLKYGALLIDGCRLAHSMQMDRLKIANASQRVRRSVVRDEEISQESHEPGTDSPEPEAGIPKPEAGKQERVQERVPHICPVLADVGEHDPIPARTANREPNQEPGPRCPAPGAPSSVTPEPCAAPCEENWDQILVARAARLDELMEEQALPVGSR